MVRIKNITNTRTAAQLIDASNIWFGLDVISEDLTAKVTGSELEQLLGTAVTNVTFTTNPLDENEVTLDVSGTTGIVPLANDTPGSETAGLMSVDEHTNLDLLSDLRTTFSVSYPLAGTSVKIGTFGTSGGDIPLTDVFVAAATISFAGVMSAADKVILNALASGAQAIRTPDAIEVRFFHAAAADPIFPDVDHVGAGPMPALGGAWMTTTNTPYGPPDAANEYLFGFQYTASPASGFVKAFKFDYELLTNTHGLTSASIGKPLVWNGTTLSILNDTLSQWPTGLLKYVAATDRVAFARPGDVLTIPNAQLEAGYTFANGRFMFWDLSSSGGQWVSTKPTDSLDILPDMIEILRLNDPAGFFQARVTEFGPVPPSAGTPSGGGAVVLDTADFSGPAADGEELGINISSAETWQSLSGVWTPIYLDRNTSVLDHGSVTGALPINLGAGVMNRKITLIGNVTISFSANPDNAAWIVWEIANTGNFDITWPASVLRNESIVIVRGSGQRTIITMFWDGTNYTVQHSRKDGVHSLGIVSSPLAINLNESPYDTLFGVMSGTIDVGAIMFTGPSGLGRVGEITLMLQQPGAGGADVNWIGSSFIGRPPAVRKGPNEITVFKLLHDATDSQSYWHFLNENPSQPIAKSVQLADSTPDVTNMSLVTVDGTITSLVGGVDGQRVTLYANDATQINHTAGQLTNQAGVNLSLTAGQTATYIRQASNVWRQA